MVVVGNAVVLSKDNFWNSLLTHFKENNCLFEGSSWKHLIPSQMSFASIEPHYAERTRFVSEVSESFQTFSGPNPGAYPGPGYEKSEVSVGLFSQKYRDSRLGFEMLPEQKSSSG